MKKTICAAVLLSSACGADDAEQPSWPKPATVTVTCEEWATVPHGNSVFFNNVWNRQAAGDFAWRQCIERDPLDGNRLGWSWHWPDRGDHIYAQPQVKRGASPWAPQPNLDERFPVKIGELAGMTISRSVEVLARGELNLVTTLWLTSTGEIGGEPRPESIVAEVMFWTYATKALVDPAGSRVGSVESSGQTWDIWLNEDWHDVSGINDNRWVYVAFVARHQGSSASYDPVALLRSEPLAHLGFEDAWISDVELGSEIMRGDGLIWVDRFDVDLEHR